MSSGVIIMINSGWYEDVSGSYRVCGCAGMMIDVLWSLLCTWWAKWPEQPPAIMKRSQR